MKRLFLLFAALFVAAMPASADTTKDAAPGLPACDDAAVLARIVDRQHWAERNTWRDGVRIAAIEGVRQAYPGTRFVSAIEHRHCVARARLDGARDDRLFFVISRRQGFASVGWGVEFCMPNHDPYRVYDGGCRVLK